MLTVFEVFAELIAGNNGRLENNTGWLRAERELLQDHGWQYRPETRCWHPPEL